MEVIECIKTRTCVRKYKNREISDKDLKEILEAAIAAPSSGNSQDWEFIIVRDTDTKRSLAEAALGQKFIEDASVVIVVCCNYERNFYGERGKYLYSIQNSAAAIENLMLAAWDKGIGSCWVGAFNEIRVRNVLMIPDNARPLAIITLGYPEGEVKKPERLPLDAVIHWEKY